MDSLKTFPESMSSHFYSVLAVLLSDVIEYLSFSVYKLMVIWVNLSFPLKGYFLALFFSWTDSNDPISFMSSVGGVFNLDGFSTDFNPAIPLLLFSLLVSLTCWDEVSSFTCQINTG